MKSSLARPLRFHPVSPWPYFFIFLSANTLLSYFPLSIESKLCIGLLGLVLPFFWVWRFPTPTLSKSSFQDQREFLLPLTAWGFGLVGLLSLGARFTHLTTLFVWPNFDESSYGFDAFHLADHAGPRLFYGVSQAPPLYVWGLALFFKLFGVSLTTLWLFPALVSLCAVPLAYAAARTFFSRSFAFFCALLMAGSFWPVFVGRFSLMTILILPLECLAFLCLGRFLKAKDFRARQGAAWALGWVWGLGFYSHLHWPVVVALTGLPLAAWLWERRRESAAWSLAARAGGTALALSYPLWIAVFQRHYGGYLAHLWAFNSQFSWDRQLEVWASCLTSPFWGMDPNVHTYQPEWGGFLNPVLASLFFLGVLEAVRRGLGPLGYFLAAGYFLCLLPGLLTRDMETFRLFPMVPLLVIGAALGFSSILDVSKKRTNLLWLLALMLPSLVLDGIHLFGVYHRIWDSPASWGYYTKSIGRYRAFGMLEEWRKKEGPGLIFPDFVSGLPDQSLSVATYGYNAALNPRVPLSQVRWAAVLTNVNYQPFLKSRFPDGVAYALSKDFPEPDGGWMLFAFPLDEKRQKKMEPWCQAQKALESFEDVNLCYVMGQSFNPDLEVLSKMEPAFQGDPFLRAVFFEKQADLETKQIILEAGEKPILSPAALGTAVGPAIHSLEKAVTEGYPAAHLYEHLGVLWLMCKRADKAGIAFKKAVHSPLDLTDSRQFLSALDSSAGEKP